MADRRRVIKTAERLVAKGKLEAAVREYRKVLADSQEDTSTLNRVGDLYARLNRLDEAIELFTRAARHFVDEGFYVKAIAIYKKIIRLDPTRIGVYETLADLYHRQGLTNEARTQYQVVADYFAKERDPSAVRSIYEKMVQLEPENPSHRVKLAELYCEAGEIAEAMEEYREIASFMLERDKTEEALKVFLGAFELNTDDVGFITDATMLLRQAGQADAAKRLLAAAVERNPKVERVSRLSSQVEAPAEGEAAPSEGEAAPSAPAAAIADAHEESGQESEEESVVLLELDEEEPEDEEESLAASDEPSVAEEPPAAAETSPPSPAEPPETDELELELETLEEGLETAELPLDAVAAWARDAEAAAEVAAEAEEPRAIEDEESAAVEDGAERASERALELLTEARVLSNYGLDEKALELGEQALALDASELETHKLLHGLYLDLQRFASVVSLAPSTRRVAREQRREADWLRLAELLEEHGFEISEYGLVAPEVEPLAPAAESESAASAELEDEPVAEPESAPPAISEEPEETRLDWLEVGTSSGSIDAAGESEELFGAEDRFFDLAAELEEELRVEEERLGDEIGPQIQEQSLEEIVEGFKKGVAEILSGEDYDTHFNLGIAYREMGLVDEAIGEFQLAAKEPRFLVDCCSLLGTCFLEKGFADLAIKWYERGLEAPQIGENERLGLLYELGNLFMTLGDPEAARKLFVDIYGTNSNYRDVVAKLEELKQRE